MYTQISDLPQSIREELPESAQELYRVAYNRALEKYQAKDDKSTDDASLTEAAHNLAWRKVQEEYQKDEQGHWQHHPIGEHMDKDKMPHKA